MDEGIRLRTQKAITSEPVASRGADLYGSRWASGVKIYVDGEDQTLEILIDDFNSQGAVKREPLRIGAGGGPENRFHGSIDDVRIYKPGVVAGRGRDAGRSHAGDGDRGAAGGQARRRRRPTRSAITSSSTRSRPTSRRPGRG